MKDKFDETLCGICQEFLEIEIDDTTIIECTAYDHTFDKWFRPRKNRCKHFSPESGYDPYDGVENKKC